MTDQEKCKVAELIYGGYPLVKSHDWWLFTNYVESDEIWKNGRHSCNENQAHVCYRCGLETYFQFAEEVITKLAQYAELTIKKVKIEGNIEILPKSVDALLKLNNIAKNRIIEKAIGRKRLVYFLKHGEVKTFRHKT